MRGVSKKMFISILTSVIVFVTMVATTFAWVGIFTYANTDSFNMNLKVSKSNNYFLTISSKDSTNNNDYSDSVPLNEIQRQVLKNWDVIRNYDDFDNATINSIYNNKTYMNPVTPVFDDTLTNIKSYNYLSILAGGETAYEKNSVIKFDLFLSITTLEGIDQDTTGINSSVVLDELQNTLTGIVNDYYLKAGNPIRNGRNNPSNFDWMKYDAYKNLTDINEEDGVINYIDKRNIKVDSSSAARFALEVYNPIKLTDTYTGNEVPVNTVIYQGGSALPTYDENTDVYSMGGILPEEYNFALQEVNLIYSKNYTIPQQTKDYESKVRTLTGSKKDNLVWKAPTTDEIDTSNINYLGVMDGIQTKQKISVYFWFEGWDSDCLKVIDKKRVTLNLTFSADIDE